MKKLPKKTPAVAMTIDEQIRSLSILNRPSLFEKLFHIRIIRSDSQSELNTLLMNNASAIADALELQRRFIDFEMTSRNMIDFDSITREKLSDESLSSAPSPDENVWRIYNRLRKKRRRLYTELRDCLERIMSLC